MLRTNSTYFSPEDLQQLDHAFDSVCERISEAKYEYLKRATKIELATVLIRVAESGLRTPAQMSEDALALLILDAEVAELMRG
jgi:hypothetical protein